MNSESVIFSEKFVHQKFEGFHLTELTVARGLNAVCNQLLYSNLYCLFFAAFYVKLIAFKSRRSYEEYRRNFVSGG